MIAISLYRVNKKTKYTHNYLHILKNVFIYMYVSTISKLLFSNQFFSKWISAVFNKLKLSTSPFRRVKRAIIVLFD